MSEALKALKSASRRGLQALAKELRLCKGNVKSDVIVSHAIQYLDSHPQDGEQVLLSVLGRNDIVPPKASPLSKKKTPTKKTNADIGVSVKVELNAKVNNGDKREPEVEPVLLSVFGRDAIVPPVAMPISEKVSPMQQKNANIDVCTMEKFIVEEKKSDKLEPEVEPVTPADSDEAKTSGKKMMTNNEAVIDVKLALAETSIKSTPANIKINVKASPSAKTFAKNTLPASIGRKRAPMKKTPLKNKKTAPLAGIEARNAVEALVNSIPDLTFVGYSRVRCSTTGHEMKADVNMINTYIRGKRYQKARNLKLSFAKYSPMFVDHPDESKPDLLWCNVTELVIVRDENCVKKHIAGPKYRKQLPIWKQEEAAKKSMEEERTIFRTARIEASKKRRLDAAEDDSAKRPVKPKRRK